MGRVRDALRGDLSADLRRLGTKTKEPAVGNLILATVRTLAQRVGIMPRLHATSVLPESERGKRRAERHESALALRLQATHFPSLLPQGAYWLASSGFLPIVLKHDTRLGHSRIAFRDPLSCYPDTVWPHEPQVDDALFVFNSTAEQVQTAFPECVIDFGDPSEAVTVCEYHGPENTCVYIVEPEVREVCPPIPNPRGQSNIWIARDLTPDFDFYGQFDQVLPIMEAQARLVALMEAYAEQQVSAETNVVGEISSNNGEYAIGPGAVNVIEPAPGAGVTKANNNMSPQVFQQLGFFEREIRTTASIPAQMQGEPGVSYATGRGIEKLTAVVDENVSHYQNVLGLALSEVVNAVPRFEEGMGVSNPGFAPDIRVHLQFLAGADPATTVRHLQMVGAKVMSRRTAMDQSPEYPDPDAEERKIVLEALREAMVSNVLAQASEGAADPKLLTKLAKDVQEGKNLEQALEDFYASNAPPVPEGAMPPAGGEGGLDLASMLGLTPQGNAVGGVMGRQEIV